MYFNRFTGITWLRYVANLKNVFLRQTVRQSSSGSRRFNCKPFHVSIVAYASVWSYLKTELGYSGMNNSLFEDAALKRKIRDALVLLQQEKFDEAENRLHVCLKEAEEENNEAAVTYIFDVLANMFYMKKDYELAEKSFLELMRRLLNSGRPEDDPALIEISLKLSDIYATKGELEKAESGFLFAVDKQRERMNQFKRKQVAKLARPDACLETGFSVFHDIHALMGMSLEAYARFLIGQKRFSEGEEVFQEALQISTLIYGPTHQQTVIMLNNYSSVCLRMHNFESAEKHLVEVIRRSKGREEFLDMIPGFYCNLAEARWHSGNQDAAVDNARTAVKLAGDCKNDSVVELSKQFLSSLENDYVEQHSARKS